MATFFRLIEIITLQISRFVAKRSFFIRFFYTFLNKIFSGFNPFAPKLSKVETATVPATMKKFIYYENYYDKPNECIDKLSPILYMAPNMLIRMADFFAGSGG